jgi:ribokinase
VIVHKLTKNLYNTVLREKSMYDVITSGSATIDAFVQTGNKLFRGTDGTVSVPFGSKIAVEKILFEVGGGGTNTAVSLTRLGLKVAFLGKVGNDYNGERIVRQLRQESVDTSFVRKGREGSGFSVVLDAYRHDRTILTFKGSNDHISFSELPLARMRTKWFYLASMMNQSFKTIERLSGWAQRKGIRVMFNPSSYLTERGIGFLREIVSKSDILVMNNEESMMLIKKNSVKERLKGLMKYGPEIAIVTDGPNGVYLHDGTGFYSARPHKIDVVETTGAGDAFGSGFLAGYIKTNDVKYALRLGLAIAETVIQTVGNKHNLPTWNQAVAFVKSHPTPIKRF